MSTGAKKKKAPPPAAPAAKPGLEHHALDLEQPSDWAALVGLVQTARAGAVTWKNLVLAGKKRPGPLPPETWPAEMPMSGKVEFDVKAPVTKPGNHISLVAPSDICAPLYWPLLQCILLYFGTTPVIERHRSVGTRCQTDKNFYQLSSRH